MSMQKQFKKKQKLNEHQFMMEQAVSHILNDLNVLKARMEILEDKVGISYKTEEMAKLLKDTYEAISREMMEGSRGNTENTESDAKISVNGVVSEELSKSIQEEVFNKEPDGCREECQECKYQRSEEGEEDTCICQNDSECLTLNKKEV